MTPLNRQFTFESALFGLLGGFLIAIASSAHLLLRGRITGISGICQAISSPFLTLSKRRWRLAFLAGMMLASSATAWLWPTPFDADALDPSPLLAVISGMLVGAGTKLGSGCTSGHGVCGLPRFSRRSIVAVLTFMAVGVLTSSTVGVLGIRQAIATPTKPSALLSTAIAAGAAAVLAVLLATGGNSDAIGSSSCAKDSLAPRARVDALLSAAVGALFALGLSVSGMVRPSRVLNFLDILGSAGGWDGTLAFVLGGALAVNAGTFALILRRPRPLLASMFELPTAREITSPLVLGSALFGLGWGLAGICPGPGIVILAAGKPVAALFILAFVAGQAAIEVMQSRQEASAPMHATVPMPSASSDLESHSGNESTAHQPGNESAEGSDYQSHDMGGEFPEDTGIPSAEGGCAPTTRPSAGATHNRTTSCPLLHRSP